MSDFRWFGNARVTPWMHYRLTQLDADLYRLFGVRLVGNSGIRLAEEQLAIWYARYTRTPNGRKVYDTRWWNGQLWYRIDPAGTVAQPKTSNHEIQGDTAAVDIADTGSDAGITSKTSARGRWLRQNAWRYDLVAEGDSFGEGWHFKVLGIFRTPPTGAVAGGQTSNTSTVPEDEDMSIAVRLNKTHLFHIGYGKIKHLNKDTPVKGNHNVGPATLTMRIVQPDDKWIEMNTAEFLEQLDAFLIPRSVVDTKTGYVRDVSKDTKDSRGEFTAGGAWSWERAAYQNSLGKPAARY